MRSPTRSESRPAARQETTAGAADPVGASATAAAEPIPALDPDRLLRRAEHLGHRIGSTTPRRGPVVQRVLGLTARTHVEVHPDEGPLWYGQVVEELEDAYRIRVGGTTDRVVTVGQRHVYLHPTPRLLKMRRDFRGVPGADFVAPRVVAWTQRKKQTHDPYKQLELMATAWRLSQDTEVQKLAADENPEAQLRLQEYVRKLESDLGRQLVQGWEMKPSTVIENLGLAWPTFVEGVKALAGSQDKLDAYLGKCLAHDKGYAQTLEAAQSYYLFLFEREELSFAEVLNKALLHEVNENVWVGGQLGSGVIRDQLRRGPDPSSKVVPVKKQEEAMWIRLITSIVNAYDPREPDWNYVETIRENKEILLLRVQELVPVEISTTGLKDVLDLF